MLLRSTQTSIANVFGRKRWKSLAGNFFEDFPYGAQHRNQAQTVATATLVDQSGAADVCNGAQAVATGSRISNRPSLDRIAS